MADNIYEHLGVPTLINAAGTYTVIGGSRMSSGTLEAIRQAASHHVEIRELQRVVHGKIAQMTRNEAAFICNGAACGLYLCTGAAIAKKYGRPAYYLEKEIICKSEIIIFSSHRNPYGFAVSQFGAKVREIGYPNIILPLTKRDLEMAINENTAAIFFFAGDNGGWIAPGGLSFEDTVDVAKAHDVPVVVDCAAQIPPIDTLWRYTEAGADAVVISGGKDLKGPQASGLVLGKQHLLSHVTETGFPNYGYGRMLKTGREEIVATYWAIKEALETDPDARDQWAEAQIMALASGLEGSVFSVKRTYPNEAGQPMARASVVFPQHISEKRVLELLMQGTNRVMCNSEHPNQVFVNPMTLRDGEIDLVIKKFLEIEQLI
ncbi:hypothetical protein [Endozoicomonas ascidiicola]|uniref:hypothetical protein n=1 Tax=Endozoicomonas ascidiicola TaxID=1698521 RepID=UPI00082F0F32|nr:hypothetical protein [Endozoicomonas ascidiicola]